MRIEPRVLDWNIEKKSLREKKPVQDMDSYESLFMDDDSIHETLSELEVVDQAFFDARQIGKAFVPDMDTKEVESASVQESFEEASELLQEVFNYSPDQIEEFAKFKKKLEEAIRDVL